MSETERPPGPHEPVYANCDELPEGHDWQDHAEYADQADKPAEEDD